MDLYSYVSIESFVRGCKESKTPGTFTLHVPNLLYAKSDEVIGYGLSLLRRSIVLHEEQKGIGPELSKQNIPFFRENRRMLIGPEVEMYALSLYQNLEIPSGVKEKDTSCVMCHVENELKKQQKTAIITLDGNDLITSYEEKPKEPKGNLAVPPFYCYRACDMTNSFMMKSIPGSSGIHVSSRCFAMLAWKCGNLVGPLNRNGGLYNFVIR